MSQQRNIWGFYPSRHEKADGDFGDVDVFRDQGLIGIGWPLTGNLQTFVADNRPKADFALRVCEAYQHESDKWCRDAASVLYKFLCEAQPGEIVVYACKRDEQVYIGRIRDTEEGCYKYDAATDKRLHWECRHFRAVHWLKKIPYATCLKQELAQIRTQNKFWRMKACPEKFREFE